MVAFSCSEKRRRRSVSGVDRRHYGWHETLLNAAHELPGDTLAEKFRNYFISLGFTEKEVDDVREFLLEPKPDAK